MSNQKHIYFLLILISMLSISNVSHAEIEETISEQFKNVTNIELNNISMKVDVTTSGDDQVTVRLFGPEKLQDFVKINRDKSALIIQQLRKPYSVGDVSVITHSTSNGSSRSVVSVGDKTTIIEGDGIVFTSSEQYLQLRMEIALPKGVPLSLNDFSGKATIGDIQSPFIMQGSGKVIAGELYEVDLNTKNNAKVEIDNVSHRLNIVAKGNSKLKLKQGNVDEMQAELSGNSRVSFDGHAGEGSFLVTDNGKLFVASVDEPRQSHTSKNGKIRFGAGVVKHEPEYKPEHKPEHKQHQENNDGY